ncbi:MAG: hypothetical protein ACE5HV_14940 [Acidobacteriota bacterium]
MTKRLRSVSAEFVIVVLGVLVALAADSAMDRLRERHTRLSVLEAVRRDVVEDLAQLDARRLPFIERQRRAREYLSAFLQADQPIGDSVAFVQAVVLVGSYQTFDGNTAAIEDLTSTGTLRLIRDPRLRSRILDYYNVVEDVEEVDQAYRAAVLDHVWLLNPRIVGGVALARGIESSLLDADAALLRGAASTALDARLRAEAQATLHALKSAIGTR